MVRRKIKRKEEWKRTELTARLKFNLNGLLSHLLSKPMKRVNRERH